MLYFPYMNYMHYGYGLGAGMDAGFGWQMWVPPVLLLIVLWSLLWKGLALWRAANRGDKWWFIAFLILNTAGILEIIYLFVVTKAKLSDFTSSLTHRNHS